MYIENTKTGVTYYIRTCKDRAGFASCVIHRQGNTEKLVMREVYPTRSRAYHSALKACEALARNHAYFN
jgi:hypothetical protein